MCGIAGFLTTHGQATPSIVEQQVATLRYRGPDSWGVFASGRGAIGQTRLAIIDLVTGDPPITDETGNVGVALNGEIYNFQELRDEVRHKGHTLTTKGDTEVIVHLAEDLDPVELARRLDGMFAFAVWNAASEVLVLGRDRLGKKPLYYWHERGTFVFGSEIKAITAHPAVTASMDATALRGYLTFGYVSTPRTFFEGIRSVPPGHVLGVRPGAAPVLTAYWEPPLARARSEHLDLSLDEAAVEVRRQLASAVRKRMVSDVPLGAFLSGGIDSSAVVGLMAEVSPAPVHTFTIGFEDGDGFDERPFARSVAERFGTDHTEFVVAPQAVDLLDELVWHHDQPFGDSSAIPTYLLAKMTKAHVTVAQCGDGGDELFAGYERFAAGAAVGAFGRIPRSMWSLLGSAAETLPASWLSGRVGKGRRLLGAAELGLPGAFRSWISYVADADADALAPGGNRWALDDYQRIWNETNGAPTLDRLLALNLRTYLLDDLLPKVDRMAMAHGLEVRTPFLDHSLVELAFRLPGSHKLRGMSLKRVLKAATRDLLPPSILDRPKHGFGVPLDRWFREDLAEYVAGTLGSPTARVREHLVPSAVDSLLAEHGNGQSHGHALWTLLTLELFLRRQGW